MKNTDYLKLINKYILNDLTKGIYLVHVTLVTDKALRIAKKLNLSNEQIRFIEEAAMLHDIGIVNVNEPNIGCTGEHPYICHVIEGGKILRSEGLPLHARVAETHTGIGLFKDEIIEQKLPLPHEDFKPETLEERIISYADIFYSKNPKYLFIEKPNDYAREKIGKYGKKHTDIFDQWVKEFES